MQGDVLVEMSRAILARIAIEADLLGFELPSRQYVTIGGSVFDCEQVSVSAMSANTGIVSATGEGLDVIGGCPPVWSAPFEASIVVCADERMGGSRGNLAPTVEAIESDAVKISSASAVLVNSAEALADEFGAVRCAVQYFQPSGQLVAVVATITTNLWK